MDDKQLLRAGLLARRADRPLPAREDAGRLIADHGRTALAGTAVVAAHAAVSSEPPTRGLIEALIAAGSRVVLPVVDGHDLAWGDVHSWSDLHRSAMGLLEPAGTSREAAAAAASADVLLAPALAVDRAGHRLGRGGGYYDRWLAHAKPGRVLAVVYADEVLDAVPAEPHDRPVDAALTPGGVVTLGR